MRIGKLRGSGARLAAIRMAQLQLIRSAHTFGTCMCGVRVNVCKCMRPAAAPADAHNIATLNGIWPTRRTFSTKVDICKRYAATHLHLTAFSNIRLDHCNLSAEIPSNQVYPQGLSAEQTNLIPLSSSDSMFSQANLFGCHSIYYL